MSKLQEIVCHVPLKLGQRLPVNSCRSAICFHSFVGFPYLAFAYRKRLCCRRCSPPTGVAARGCCCDFSTMGQALRSGLITALRRYYGLLRPCTPHWYSGAHGASTCASPLASG